MGSWEAGHKPCSAIFAHPGASWPASQAMVREVVKGWWIELTLGTVCIVAEWY